MPLVKENNACWCCLQRGHRANDCPYKRKYNIDQCGRLHNEAMHAALKKNITLHANAAGNNVMFQVMSIPTSKPGILANVIWDGGSNCSLITLKMAERLNRRGKPVRLTIQNVGQDMAEAELVNSSLYVLKLIDKELRTVEVKVYGIRKISKDIKRVDISGVERLFSKEELSGIKDVEGTVDVLIGIDHVSYHPQMIANQEHLIITSNRFGKCLSGSRTCLDGEASTVIANVMVNHIVGENIEDFINTESLSGTYRSKCRCNDLLNISLKEKREMKLIQRGLQFKGDHWEVRYPWKRDPLDLPNNRQTAFAILKSTEKRLMKDNTRMQMYQAQIQDMLDREVARKLTEKEINQYKGPVYYVSHHEILKEESETTPCRIVYNASANFKGHVSNDYWVKGTSLINNLAGILLRFREDYIGMAGDIQKMYHAIRISELDQHTHRFLWRDFRIYQEPDTYVINRVCFGDRPAGTIAIMALNKTAEMGTKDPRIKGVITRNTYVDDIIDSFSSHDECERVSKEVGSVLAIGGFKIKSWMTSPKLVDSKGEKVEGPTEHTAQERDTVKALEALEPVNFCPEVKKNSQKVLGVCWRPTNDDLHFSIRLGPIMKKGALDGKQVWKLRDKINGLPLRLTKRIVLSLVNRLYDPLGLVAPFVVRSKILMRKLWMNNEKKLGWDDPIPDNLQKEWNDFFIDMFKIETISFPRCIKPFEVSEDEPQLILFCDSSEIAFGCCAYVRWRLRDGTFQCNLLIAKTHVAPIHPITIVTLEVNGARLGSRLKCFIEDELRIRFSRIYIIVDSEITLGMIQRDSCKLNTYFGVRIGEIQERTNTSDWYWINNENNIADWLSRGRSPCDHHAGSDWQRGPSFLRLPESEWPVRQTFEVLDISEAVRAIMLVNVKEEDSLAARINIGKHSSYTKLVRITSRVLNAYKRAPNLSFCNILNEPTSTELKVAVEFWVRDAQSSINEFEKRFANLGPVRSDDGIYRVGQRIQKWMNHTYNEAGLVLLPGQHRMSILYAEFIHRIGHHGVMTTVSKVRLTFWITNLIRIVKSIVKGCVTCRKITKALAEQVMAPLPFERLKPSPPFYYVAVDYFGPFVIKGEVNRRTRGKGYGVILTCLATRAVLSDLASDCSTDGFLTVFRRFTSIRGYPAKLYSDNGKQFRGASRELKSILKDLDWEEICRFGAAAGVEWKFSPGDKPWQDGCVESLVKSMKKAIKLSIGAQILKYSELQTVLYELGKRAADRSPPYSIG